MQTFPTSIYVPSNWVARLDWVEVFGNAQPVEVDIGCGKGSFLLWSAQTRATTNFVGVDRLLRRLRKIDRKVQRIGLPNVRLIRVEASYLVGFLVPEASVAAYHVYFPDPWPKRRHRQRRLICGAFLSDLHRTLCEGGAVNCATDDAEYFQVDSARISSGRTIHGEGGGGSTGSRPHGFRAGLFGYRNPVLSLPLDQKMTSENNFRSTDNSVSIPEATPIKKRRLYEQSRRF